MKKEINILMVKNAKDCEYLHIYNTDKLMNTVRPSDDKWVKAKIVYDEPRNKLLQKSKGQVIKTMHEEFLDSYSDYPNQDTEGYIPDRGAFKTGFCAGWRKKEHQLSAKNDELTLLADKLDKAEHRLKIANEISKDQLDATNEWIEKYKQECIKVKEAEKVIEFYADRGNWQISDLMTYSEIIDSDLTGGYIAAGGGKARQYFKDNKLSQKGDN